MAERRLGRGLDFFLSEAGTGQGGDEVRQVELSSIVPSPFQPRREFHQAELDELAQSIRATGLLQPVLVRRVKDKHELIAGERRWRAAKIAGLERIPALVRDVPDELAAVLGLVENLQRTDLNAIEKAAGLQKLQALAKTTQEDVARRVGLDRSTVANFVRLLDLPSEVQALVSRGTLSMGHARALLALKQPEEQRAIAETVVKQRLSVRQVEQLVHELGGGRKATEPSTQEPGKPQRPVWLKEVEQSLAEALQAGVHVRYGRKRSRITIECIGREEFERVLDRLKTLGN